MKTLDELLYAWLTEPRPNRFDLAYAEYFTVAFLAIVRYLRKTGWDTADLEDVAQESLLKFYNHIATGGIARSTAAKDIDDTLPRLQPLTFNAFHTRQVVAWKADVRVCVEETTGRTASARHAVKSGATKDINSKIKELRRRGCKPLMADVCARITTMGVGANPSIEETPDNEIVDIMVSWGEQLLANDSDLVTQESLMPGIGAFVFSIVTIVKQLPLLELDSNGLLFVIATRTFRDAARRRKRQSDLEKPGAAQGGKTRAPTAVAPGENLPNDPRPLTRPDHEPDPHFSAQHRERDEPEDGVKGQEPRQAVSAAPSSGRIPQDPKGPQAVTQTQGVEEAEVTSDVLESIAALEFFEKFLTYLKGAYRVRDPDRLLDVIEGLIDGLTQEQIAEKLNITRDQVRYAIQQIRDAYLRFDPSVDARKIQRAPIVSRGERS